MKLARLLIFLGSFLSFFVQPLVGRTILPYFGGSAAVWVTCLVVFQFLLLVGYGYAFLPARGRRRTHLVLVFCAAALAGAVPFLKGSVIGSLVSLPPACGVFLAVLAITGLVSVVLSANSTVIQSWVGGGREVYRLYSIGNIGSFSGLLAYPLLVEPFVPVAVQWIGLGVAIAVYGAGLAAMTQREGVGVESATRRGAAGTVLTGVPSAPVLWVVLPAVSCALMTAATTFLTTDFVPLPLMWAVLLAAFLLSYVVGFSKIGERLLGLWTGLSVLVLGFAAWSYLPSRQIERHFLCNLGAVLGLLTVVCTALHAWLCRIRPPTARLPHFYFCIALGGALGGFATGVLPPLAFNWIWEYPLCLGAVILLLGLLLLRWKADETVVLNRIALGVLACAALVIAFGRGEDDGQTGRTIYRDRGFYGVISVGSQKVTYGENYEKECDFHLFLNGKTAHGAQMMGEDVRRMPRAYHSLNGGGIPFVERRNGWFGDTNRPMRVAIVGMGIGALSAWAEKGDVFRLYEISPEVIRLVGKPEYFSYVTESKGRCEIVEGDARLELEKDLRRGERFDIVVIDTYSGDSIPTHMVTREAFRLYRALLKDGGLIAFHVSNWHVNLWPVMKAAAKDLDLEATGVVSGPVYDEYVTGCSWVFMAEKPFSPRLLTCSHLVDWTAIPDRGLMTDDCGSLIFNLAFGFKVPLQDGEGAWK